MYGQKTHSYLEVKKKIGLKIKTSFYIKYLHCYFEITVIKKIYSEQLFAKGHLIFSIGIKLRL